MKLKILPKTIYAIKWISFVLMMITRFQFVSLYVVYILSLVAVPAFSIVNKSVTKESDKVNKVLSILSIAGIVILAFGTYIGGTRP